MKNTSGKTHRPRAIDPVAFRAQATGIGNSLGASRATGLRRAHDVAESIPVGKRGMTPASEGYPAPMPMIMPSASRCLTPMHPWAGQGDMDFKDSEY